MKFTDDELQMIETSLRGTLSRLNNNNKKLEKLIEKISERNEKDDQRKVTSSKTFERSGI